MKTVFLTFSATIAAVAFLAALFFESILGAFGLVAISLDTLQSLRTSQQVVESMKRRHHQKKLATSSKFVKKPAKRIAVTAFAATYAPVVAPAAVAVTMATFEVADYCEEKEELQGDANVLFSTDTKFDLAQCMEEGKQDSIALLEQVKMHSATAVSNAFKASAKYSTEKWSAIKAASLRALEWRGEVAGELWDSSKSWMVK